MSDDMPVVDHPMVPALLEDYKTVRSAWARTDRRAFQVLSDVAGIKLPKCITFKDSDGAQYAIDVDVRVRLVEKGSPND